MFSIFHVKFVAKQICKMEDKRIEPEEPEVKEDIDHWLDKEDIGNNFMLRQQYMNQNRQDELDHGFGGKDDDGFRGLDSADGFDGPYTSGFDFDDFDMER